MNEKTDTLNTAAELPEVNKGEVLIYQSDDGLTKIDVRLEEDTVWLTQLQLAELYKTSKSNISEHITNIFEEGELVKEATVRKFRTVQSEGDRQVEQDKYA